MTDPACTCPQDSEGVVVQYSPSCPVPGHNLTPPSTAWPDPDPVPPAPPCKCTYDIYGNLVIDPQCPRHTH